MMNITSADIITREELYEMVWKEPIAVFTRKNKLSEYALRKACKAMNIPTPKAGYWENVKLGKKISRLSLGKDPAAPSFINLSSIKKTGTITQPQKKQDPEYKKTNKYNGLLSSSKNDLDIRVSEALVDRAIRWMNYFIETVKTRNHTITIENGSTYVVLYGQAIKIYLRELTKTTGPRSKWINTPLMPTGLLAFKIDGYWGREWRDGTATLEEQFMSIIEELEIKAWALQGKSLDRNAEINAAREIEKNNQLKKMLVEKELDKFKQLLQRAERWQKAQSLKAYIAQWKADTIASNEMTPEIAEKIQWAEEKADWYDPRTTSPDDLFSSIDKNTLSLK